MENCLLKSSAWLQVQANVQTVLQALGLVENSSAAQDAKALQEVCRVEFADQNAIQLQRPDLWPCNDSHLTVLCTPY